MSVLIKDMEMPKSCNSCDLLQDYDGDMYCPLNTYLNFGDIENVPDYVMIGCPLSEVPNRKHGKWINDGKGLYKCTACGELWIHWWATVMPIETMYKEMRFCPHCGADMRKETEDG